MPYFHKVIPVVEVKCSHFTSVVFFIINELCMVLVGTSQNNIVSKLFDILKVYSEVAWCPCCVLLTDVHYYIVGPSVSIRHPLCYLSSHLCQETTCIKLYFNIKPQSMAI